MSNRKRGPKVVISGYYGFDNCGDEAVLLAIIHCLKRLRPDIRVTVLSNNPARTRELYGVNAVSRWNPLRIAIALLTSRLLISGGGSLLQDVTSIKSPDYYLGVIRIALFLHKKVMIYSQGVGPLIDSNNRAKVSRVLNRCHAITLRDEYSAELLEVLGVNRDIPVTCDPVMAFSRADIGNGIVKENLHSLGIIDSKHLGLNPVLLVAVRCWNDDRHIAPVAEFLDTQVGEGWDVLLVPAHYPEDTDAIAMLSARMAMRPYCVDKLLTAGEFISLTSSVDRVFSMRLHGLICAFAMGTPLIGLSYDPKVDAFMEQAGLGRYCLSFDDFDVELANRLMEELDNLPLQLLQERETHRLDMQDLAWDNADVAVWLLDSGDESQPAD
jgi:polysaccharide pyruvyl transferase CsaB